MRNWPYRRMFVCPHSSWHDAERLEAENLVISTSKLLSISVGVPQAAATISARIICLIH